MEDMAVQPGPGTENFFDEPEIGPDVIRQEGNPGS
jgi:hypothetical protein